MLSVPPRTGSDVNAEIKHGRTEGGHEMSVTWGRILVGIAVAMCLLGVGVLEVLSERGPSRALPVQPRVGDVRTEPWGEFGRATPALTADADGSERAASRGFTRGVQPRRPTALQGNEWARGPRSRTGTGRG